MSDPMNGPLPKQPTPVSAAIKAALPKHGKVKTSKPKRAHKSKQQQKQKSSVKVINDGFIQRKAKPDITGTNLQSRMVRVDAEFAEWMRREAMKNGTSITEVSRSVYQMMTD